MRATPRSVGRQLRRRFIPDVADQLKLEVVSLAAAAPCQLLRRELRPP